MLIQVKTIAHNSSRTRFQLDEKNYAGIVKRGQCDGFLALLDCANPVRWILVPARRAALLLDRPRDLAALQADCDEAFSKACTEEFTHLLSECATRMRNLTYQILRKRALQGERP
jgi:hypothetical protein